MIQNIKCIKLYLLFNFICYISLFPLNAQHVDIFQGTPLGENTKENKESSLFDIFESFLELGFTQLSRSKKKPPEDLGSVLGSIRLQNQFLSNQNLFAFQETELKDQQPKRRLSYSIKEKYGTFYNIYHAFYNHRLEYRKYLIEGTYDPYNQISYYDYSLDIYFNDYKETKFKFGIGPLDYFEDSDEGSIYYFQILTRGTYRVLTRNLNTRNSYLAYIPAEKYLLLTSFLPEYQNIPTSFIDGTTKVFTTGFGYTFASNTKLGKFFGIYNLLDFQFFRIKGDFSTFSPSILYYNTSTRSYEQITQIIYVNKNLDFNMNFIYEIGVSITINKIGFKWGVYWTLPLILDTEYLKPKGYIINIYSNRIEVNPLGNYIEIFYKGDPANQTKTFTLGLGGITFGAITKF